MSFQSFMISPRLTYWLQGGALVCLVLGVVLLSISLRHGTFWFTVLDVFIIVVNTWNFFFQWRLRQRMRELRQYPSYVELTERDYVEL